MRAASPRGLSENCDVRCVASEVGNVLPDPLQSEHLVFQASVAFKLNVEWKIDEKKFLLRLTRDTKVRIIQAQKTISVQTIIKSHENDVPVHEVVGSVNVRSG
jgi:hypothetical protein